MFELKFNCTKKTVVYTQHITHIRYTLSTVTLYTHVRLKHKSNALNLVNSHSGSGGGGNLHLALVLSTSRSQGR